MSSYSDNIMRLYDAGNLDQHLLECQHYVMYRLKNPKKEDKVLDLIKALYPHLWGASLKPSKRHRNLHLNYPAFTDDMTAIISNNLDFKLNYHTYLNCDYFNKPLFVYHSLKFGYPLRKNWLYLSGSSIPVITETYEWIILDEFTTDDTYTLKSINVLILNQALRLKITINTINLYVLSTYNLQINFKLLVTHLKLFDGQSPAKIYGTKENLLFETASTLQLNCDNPAIDTSMINNNPPVVFSPYSYFQYENEFLDLGTLPNLVAIERGFLNNSKVKMFRLIAPNLKEINRRFLEGTTLNHLILSIPNCKYIFGGLNINPEIDELYLELKDVSSSYTVKYTDEEFKDVLKSLVIPNNMVSIIKNELGNYVNFI